MNNMQLTAKPNAHDLQSIASQLGRDEEIEISYKVIRRSTAPAPAPVQQVRYVQPAPDYSESIEYAASELNMRMVVLFVVLGFAIGGAMAIAKQIAVISAILAAAGYPAIVIAVALAAGCVWLAKEVFTAIRR
jgi:hypothetical protein